VAALSAVDCTTARGLSIRAGDGLGVRRHDAEAKRQGASGEGDDGLGYASCSVRINNDPNGRAGHNTGGVNSG
jgi:hypothetical protein